MREIFKNKNFTFLWLGQSVSSLGTWINFVGLNLYVYSLFDSGKILGIFLVIRMLPSLLFGSLGGYLADRFPRKKIMIICDLARALIVLGYVFTRDLYVFFALGMLLSAIDKIFIAANGAFIPNVVNADNLLSANSIIRMTRSIITVIGPAVGAVLVSSYSYRWVFIIDSFTFVFSVICILFITPYRRVETSKDRPSFIEEFKAASAFFKAQVGLFFLAVARLIDALGSGAYNTSLPIFSKLLTSGKGAVYGWLIGAWSLGEFTGALLVNYLGKKRKVPHENLFAIAVVVMACGMGFTFHSESLYPALILIYLGGLGDGVSNVIFNTTLMQKSPDHLRGKIFGTVTAMVYTAVAVGIAASGFFIDKYPQARKNSILTHGL